MKKKKKKDEQKPVRKTTPETPAQPVPTETQEENPFDFGGMPARDLKKNLGCG